MKQYHHPTDGKTVIEFGFEDWEAGKMAGIWLPAISCEWLLEDPSSYLRPHPETGEPCYFFLPMKESLRIDEAKENRFNELVDECFKAHRLAFEYRYNKSRDRTTLISNEIKRIEDLFHPDRHSRDRNNGLRPIHPNADPTYYFPEDYTKYFVNGNDYPYSLIEHKSLNLPVPEAVQRAMRLEAYLKYLDHLKGLGHIMPQQEASGGEAQEDSQPLNLKHQQAAYYLIITGRNGEIVGGRTRTEWAVKITKSLTGSENLTAPQKLEQTVKKTLEQIKGSNEDLMRYEVADCPKLGPLFVRYRKDFDADSKRGLDKFQKDLEAIEPHLTGEPKAEVITLIDRAKELLKE